MVAHHDLGHLANFRGLARRLSHLAPVRLMSLLHSGPVRFLRLPDWERAADLHGLRLCVDAG